MVIVLMVTTPDIVTVWEAVLTFGFFFILVGLAFAADKNWFRSTPDDEVQMRDRSTAEARISPTPYKMIWQ